MGERLLAKIMLVLGVLFLFVAALFPGSQTPWTNFQNTLAATSFPAFDNPFSDHAYKILLAPDANATTSDFSSITGCSAYWECLASDDGNLSYVTLDAGHAFVNVHSANMSGAGLQIISVVLTISCRSTGAAPWNNWHFDGGLREQVIAECPEGPTFTRQSINFVQVQSYAWDGLIGCAVGASLCDAINTGFSGVTLDAGNTTGTLDVSYIELDVYVIQASACNNGNAFTTTGCQLGKIVDTIVKFFQFLFNGIIFIGAIAVYVVTIVGSFFVGILAMFAFFFAIPGMPTQVQAVFDVVLVAFLVIIFVTMMKLLPLPGRGE